MTTIYKYGVSVKDSFTLEVPALSKVLSVAIDEKTGDPVMWILVKINERLVRRRFIVVGTGNPMPEDLHLDFIGTFQLGRGTLVFHLFEVRE